MGALKIRRLGTTRQYLISLALILATSISCYLSIDFIGYRVVALVLLLMVSILAMLFDILPVLLTAVLSALTWNYFFIPPVLNFHIGTAEDVLMFLMYFVVALINAVLTFKIRQFEKKARDEEEREKTIKLYNTLLSSLSHELRTPISAIIGSIDTIKENTRISDVSRNELYQEIEIASFRLNRQVENLLNMSRLEAGVLQPKLDWCDVNELVHTVIKNNKTDAIDHDVVFEADENLPLVKLDRGLIEQVLHNLLHNAIQHTSKRTRIVFEVSYTGNACRIHVSDTGSGFPEHEFISVFEKFYRLPHTTAGGTGLGLSIAKGFTEAHRGTIQLTNMTHGGARFTIEIPSETPVINSFKDELA